MLLPYILPNPIFNFELSYIHYKNILTMLLKNIFRWILNLNFNFNIISNLNFKFPFKFHVR